MNYRSALVNCNNPDGSTIEADPDIAGIGVLIAFAASAWFTLLFCVAYYCINPDVSFANHVGQNAPVHPVDKICLDKLDALWTRTGRKPSDKWAQALEKAVLAFSDQQCITGIAILLSGYSQLRLQNTNPMTVYNWQISVDLAWFSSITHLTTLTCLRHYFRQRRALSVFRIACMTVNAVILAVSVGSTGWQLVDVRLPAWCLFDTSWISLEDYQSEPVYNSLYMSITATFLAVSYLTRIIQLCPYKSTIRRYSNNFLTFPTAVSNRLRRSTRKLVLQSPKTLLFVHWLVYRPVLTVHCLLKAVFDLYSSMLWEITWLLIALAWGSLRVMTDRLGEVAYSPVVFPTGNAWGFGQVIAIIFLLLPFISFFEVVYDTVFSQETPSSSANPPFTTINVTGSSVNSQHTSSPDQDLYRHRWFCMIILLIYSLSLAVAADLLYIFPYERLVVTPLGLEISPPWSGVVVLLDSKSLIIHYVVWASVNTVLVGVFTFLAISIPDGDPRLRLHWIGHQVLLLFTSAIGRRPPDSAAPRPEKAWVATLTWYILISGILAGSITYDWRWIQNYVFSSSPNYLGNYA